MLTEILLAFSLIVAWLVYYKKKGSNPHPDSRRVDEKFVWKNTFVGEGHQCFSMRSMR